QYQAYNGLAEWSRLGKQTELRSVFSIHPESITLIASEKSGIREIKDLKDKRVNLGNPGSGHLQNSKDVLEAAGLTERDLSAEYVRAVEAPGLLQDERVDAFFYTVGHPSSNIKEATSGRIKVFIVPIRGPDIDKMLEKYPYYAKSKISHSFYRYALNTEDIETIGVKATFVTSKKVDEDIVYAITKEVFENFEDFKALHPAYEVLTKENMLKGLSAPIHKGALKYYKEFKVRMKAQGRTQVNYNGSSNDRWLCPSHPDNRKLEIESMLEVARKYDVDGLHFDYIRYPGKEGCFCKGCRLRFEKP
ncbi:unnamed protein product, partial [marine sediment metagenome]